MNVASESSPIRCSSALGKRDRAIKYTCATRFAGSAPPPTEFDSRHPDNVAPLVVWLGSAESRDINGQVFNVSGGVVGVAEGWRRGPSQDKGDRWEPGDLGPVVRDLVARSYQPPRMTGARA